MELSPKTTDQNDSRLRLLESAATMFADRGDVSIRTIAEHAGVNHGLVHYYFGSKDKLRIAAFQHLVSQVSDGLTARRVMGPEDIVQLLGQMRHGDTRCFRMLVRALLDGDTSLWADQSRFPYVDSLLESLAPEHRDAGRAIVAEHLATTLGYFLLKPWLLDSTEVDETDMLLRLTESQTSLLQGVLRTH